MTDKLTFEKELNNIDAAIYAVGEVTDFDKGYAQALKVSRPHVVNMQANYAPRIEMTPTQYAFITSEYEQENIVDAVANISVDDILRENFHADFWAPLTQREVVSAWLHPETIINSETGKSFVEE